MTVYVRHLHTIFQELLSPSSAGSTLASGLAATLSFLIARNYGREEVRIIDDAYNGQQFLTMRVWFYTAEGGYAPSRKGLTIRPHELDLAHAATVQYAEEHGIELSGSLEAAKKRAQERTDRILSGQPEPTREAEQIHVADEEAQQGD